MVGNRITNVPGSSDYFVGGVIAYSNELKQRLLGVQERTLTTHGAVSEETAREMALGARWATGADLGIATTGIAGPDGGTAEKPVGTVAIALAADGLDDGVRSRVYRFVITSYSIHYTKLYESSRGARSPATGSTCSRKPYLPHRRTRISAVPR